MPLLLCSNLSCVCQRLFESSLQSSFLGAHQKCVSELNYICKQSYHAGTLIKGARLAGQTLVVSHINSANKLT